MHLSSGFACPPEHLLRFSVPLWTSSPPSSPVYRRLADSSTWLTQKTDLFALNPTVEAARAGEVGAGFAVAASLAQLAHPLSQLVEQFKLDGGSSSGLQSARRAPGSFRHNESSAPDREEVLAH